MNSDRESRAYLTPDFYYPFDGVVGCYFMLKLSSLSKRLLRSCFLGNDRKSVNWRVCVQTLFTGGMVYPAMFLKKIYPAGCKVYSARSQLELCNRPLNTFILGRHGPLEVGGPLRLRLEAKEMSLFFASNLQPLNATDY